ncbi:MAG: serine/threonine protein kinase [Polyangiales bacterium]
MLPDPHAEIIGRAFAERYRVVDLISEGGMGAVYLAEHLFLGRRVALKRLHPRLANNPKAIARFRREARAAAALKHDHIVDILDLGFDDDGAPFLVMEYLEGETLAAKLERQGALPPRRACHIVGQVLAALASVHAKQIIHRDLKPDNIFLLRRGRRRDHVKVLDFGVSKVKHASQDHLDLTKTGVMLGTPYYMSPEQARGDRDLDHRIDIYAVGVLLYECLTGLMPFEAANYHALLRAIIGGETERVESLAPHIDSALSDIVHRAMALDPSARFATAEAMWAALLPFGAPDDALEPEAASPAPTPALQAFARDTKRSVSSRLAGVEAAGRALSRSGALPSSTPRSVRCASGRPSDGDVHVRTTQSDALLPAATVRTASQPEVKETTPNVQQTAYPLTNHTRRTPARRIADAGSRSGYRPSPPTVSYDGSAWPASTSDAPQARGALIAGVTRYVSQVHGVGALRDLLAQVPPEDRADVEGIVLAIAWLPMRIYDTLLALLEQRFGNGDGAQCRAVGEATAQHDLPLTHRIFIQSATPETLVHRLPRLWRSYFNLGCLHAEAHAQGGYRIHIEYDAGATVLREAAMLGFLRQTMVLAGVVVQRIEMLHSVQQGGGLTRAHVHTEN